VSDDTPTKVLPTAQQPSGASRPPISPPPTVLWRPRAKPPTKGPFVAFILVAIILIASSGFLLYLVFGRAGTPIAAPTAPPTTSRAAPKPSATPTTPVETTPTAAPPAAGTFTSFSAAPTAECGGHGRHRQPVDLQVTWSTQNATQVWVANGSADAVQDGEQIPLDGTQDSFANPVPINCNQAVNTFTMTLVGADGAHVDQTWTVTVSRRRD
jgi:hypothetical protein